MGKKKRFSTSRRRQRERQMKQRALVFAGLGVVLLVLGGVLSRRGGKINAALEVHPEDVVYGEEIFAVHEMDGPQLDRIPFLPEDGPQPRVALPEAFYDFGEVGPTDVVEYTFYVVNVGDAPLTISRAYTTCGCTTARISARVIPPGKAAAVRRHHRKQRPALASVGIMDSSHRAQTVRTCPHFAWRRCIR